MILQQNWYIEYDNRTFSILHKPKYDKYIFKAAELFVNAQVEISGEVVEISDWVISLSGSVRDISQLLYNFFYVEEKLVDLEIVKMTFYQIQNVLKVENQYSKFFFMGSENFRINRILACMIRLNRFLEALFVHIDGIRKSLDETFIENLDEVYIYIQQKLKETLTKTQKLGSSDINIILLDTLSLILRNFGDSTMHKILDKTKVVKIMSFIQKENEVYQQFQGHKKKETEMLKDNQYFQSIFEPQEDPNLRRKKQEIVEEQES